MGNDSRRRRPVRTARLVSAETSGGGGLRDGTAAITEKYVSMKEPTVNEHAPEPTTLIRPAEIIRDAKPPMVVQLGNPADGSAGGFSFNVVWQALLQRLKVAAPLGAVLSAVSCAVLYYVTEPPY